MKHKVPSDTELSLLSKQVDEQLQALQSTPEKPMMSLGGKLGKTAKLPVAPIQQAVIEQTTGEPFGTFWQKYIHYAQRDLCLPGGLLYEQWHKWRDLESKTAVRTSYIWLAAMGIPTASVAPLAVAASVFLLNVVLKVGIEAICDGCGEKAVPTTGGTKEK